MARQDLSSTRPRDEPSISRVRLSRSLASRNQIEEDLWAFSSLAAAALKRGDRLAAAKTWDEFLLNCSKTPQAPTPASGCCWAARAEGNSGRANRRTTPRSTFLNRCLRQARRRWLARPTRGATSKPLCSRHTAPISCEQSSCLSKPG